MGVEMRDELVGGKAGGVRVGQDARRERAQTPGVLARRARFGGRRADERPDAAAGFENALPFEVGVDARHGVGVDLEIDGELTNGRQLVAGGDAARRDGRLEGALDLRVDGRRIARVDLNHRHVDDYTNILVQVNTKKGRAPGERPARSEARELAYRLTIFSESAAIIILPSFSLTSPVISTVWLTWATSFALLSAASAPMIW